MYTVYWTETTSSNTIPKTEVRTSNAQSFTSSQLMDALQFCEDLRVKRSNGAPISMITLASEDANHVGPLGVASIVDGKTPDGHDYTWSKAGRAGKMRPRDYIKETYQVE